MRAVTPAELVQGADSIDMLFYTTLDPKAPHPAIPASTTLLYKVCGNDQQKFEEACRLVRLFVEQDRVARNGTE